MYSWESFVLHVLSALTPYPHLRTAIIAQAALESGWGTTKLFTSHGNPFGMHYHDFLSDIAKCVSYDACDGKGDYAQFASPEAALEGYWRWFKHLDHYKGFEVAANKTALDWLSFIGPRYCPPGFTEAWKKNHGNHNYAEYIVYDVYPRAEKLIEELGYKPAPVEQIVSWFRLHEDVNGDIGICAMDKDNVVHATWRGKNFYALAEFAMRFKNARNIVPHGKAEWPGDKERPQQKPENICKAKGVLIDIGHGKLSNGTFDVGAVDADSKTTERSLNEIGAGKLAATLKSLGITVEIEKPGLSLADRGALAQGYDVFISYHHNWYYSKAQHSLAFLSQDATNADKLLAKMITAAISKALDDKTTPKVEVPDGGYREEGYTVPHAARATNVRACCLVEPFFIDHASADGHHQDWASKAGEAIGHAIHAWLLANR